MLERQLPSVQLQRSGLGVQSLGITDVSTGQIGWITHDRVAQVPEMDSDLIGATATEHCL